MLLALLFYDAQVFGGTVRNVLLLQLLLLLLHVAVGVYFVWQNFSMAHFNPAVTIGYFITGHITKIQISILSCCS